MEYYSATKKDGTMSFAGKWMEMEIIMLSKVSQVQKDEGPMLACFLSYMEDGSKR
jgi:hypothetical protein